MKKSLSLLLAIAMVFTMFSGVAFAADNGSDSKAKLYAAGVLKGSLSGDTMDDATWTRQNVTVLLSRLYNVEEEAQATAKGHTFTDVTDPYYDGFITWAVEEGLFTGHSDVRFGYNEDITAQQFAAVLLRALGVEHDYADAVAAAVEAGILAEELDNDSAVLRGASYDILVATLDVVDEDGKSLGERLGLEGWVPEVPAISATPVGVQTVEVKLSSAVDTDDAKLELRRGNTLLATDVKWADNDKDAVLTLKDVKITEADYSVTLKGVSEDDLVATFSANNEKVETIAFVNDRDEIAHSPEVIKLVEARNQYGELASFSAGHFGVFAPDDADAALSKNDDGYLELKLNTEDFQVGIGVLPVTVYVNDTRLSVQKTFTIGTAPLVDSIELGEVDYSNEDAGALAKKDDTATIPLTQFDQYGDIITENSDVDTVTNVIVTPYEPNFDDVEINDFDNIVVKLKKNVERGGDYNVTVYSGTAQATTTIEVRSTKVANSVEFGAFTGTIAAGDTRDHHIPIVAYDADGNELSADDIVDNANEKRFVITVSGASVSTAQGVTQGTDVTAGIVEHGEHKGKLRINNVMDQRGTIFLNIGIYTANIQSQNSINIAVQDARVPETIAVEESNAPKAALGGSSEFKLVVKDQYGEKLNSLDVNPGRYEIRTNLDADNATTVTGKEHTLLATYASSAFESFNKGFKFNTQSDDEGKADFEVKLVRLAYDSNPEQVIRTVKRSIETISNDTALTYNVKQVSDLFAAGDSSLTPTVDKDTELGKHASKLAGKLEITAKDNRGNDVAIPNNRIRDVVTSNPNVVEAVYGGVALDGFKLFGDEAGTANVTVTYQKANKETASVQLTVKVKSDAVVADSVSARATHSIGNATTASANTVMDLKIKDNYGIEYTEGDIQKYDAFLGARYSISDVKATGSATATVDHKTGAISVDAGVSEFVLTVITSSGERASTVVSRTD